ncbi:transcriptional regulator [Planctomycetota bacterium]|nr:transcriptional regulator [Planctomycetota bacterium]
MEYADAPIPVPHLNETALLRALVGGTADQTGEPFLRALVRNLAETMDVDIAWVTEYLPERDVLRARAMWMHDRHVEDYEHPVAGTPCEAVVRGGGMVHHPDNVLALFAHQSDIQRLRIVSYLGEALYDGDGRVIGTITVMDPRPMADDARLRGLFRLFGLRAAAELRRLAAEQSLQEREQQLARLVDGVMDAVVEVDEGLTVTQANQAASEMLGASPDRLRGMTLARLFDPAGRAAVVAAISGLETDAGRGSRRIGRQLGIRADGSQVPVDVGLTRCTHAGQSFHILILRDLAEQERAESAIRSLSDRAAYLEEELARALHHGDIIGRSAALRSVMEDIARVAPTHASVLVQGETGTGKELIARALHRGSDRRDRPFIAVNCAALPAGLIESELFGHERGAFTGAVRRRDGRFALADGGTLFLDEVGELSQEAQAKLLRVLQEGVIEPVGGSASRRVDVRIVAATHRDLTALVRSGSFREDLRYRLEVVPIRLPPLRERREDISLLATHFIAVVAKRLGRTPPLLDDAAIARLEAYDWPGNIRELEHVVERAVILGRNGRFDLERALPATPPPIGVDTVEGNIMTAAALRNLELRNLERAHERCEGRISGAGGMVELLGLPASTIASQLKAAGLKRAR